MGYLDVLWWGGKRHVGIGREPFRKKVDLLAHLLSGYSGENIMKGDHIWMMKLPVEVGLDPLAARMKL